MKCQTCDLTTRTLAQSKFILSHYNVCGICRLQEIADFQRGMLNNRETEQQIKKTHKKGDN